MQRAVSTRHAPQDRRRRRNGPADLRWRSPPTRGLRQRVRSADGAAGPSRRHRHARPSEDSDSRCRTSSHALVQPRVGRRRKHQHDAVRSRRLREHAMRAFMTVPSRGWRRAPTAPAPHYYRPGLRFFHTCRVTPRRRRGSSSSSATAIRCSGESFGCVLPPLFSLAPHEPRGRSARTPCRRLAP